MPKISLRLAWDAERVRENLWRFLRQTFLPNRVFETYHAILDAACHAVHDTPWRIISIGQRDWAGTGQL